MGKDGLGGDKKGWAGWERVRKDWTDGKGRERMENDGRMKKDGEM